jgi:hypothetical protein
VARLGGPRRLPLLALVVGLLMFACGVLAVGWRVDHRRLACYRDFADEALVATPSCERTGLE